MDADVTGAAGSHVHARLRLTRNGPALPKREGYMDILISGSSFRVSDETGRYVYEILGDIAAKRGLGRPPQSLEEIMDISLRFRDRRQPGVTELSGDIATNEGLIHEQGKPPWSIAANEIVPVARQIYSDGLEAQLEPIATRTLFGRACTEYHGFVEGEDNGVRYKNEITRIVSPPFMFLNAVHDVENSDHYFIREVVAFEEGAGILEP